MSKIKKERREKSYLLGSTMLVGGRPSARRHLWVGYGRLLAMGLLPFALPISSSSSTVKQQGGVIRNDTIIIDEGKDKPYGNLSNPVGGGTAPLRQWAQNNAVDNIANPPASNNPIAARRGDGNGRGGWYVRPEAEVLLIPNGLATDKKFTIGAGDWLFTGARFALSKNNPAFGAIGLELGVGAFTSLSTGRFTVNDGGTIVGNWVRTKGQGDLLLVTDFANMGATSTTTMDAQVNKTIIDTSTVFTVAVTLGQGKGGADDEKIINHGSTNLGTLAPLPAGDRGSVLKSFSVSTGKYDPDCGTALCWEDSVTATTVIAGTTNSMTLVKRVISGGSGNWLDNGESINSDGVGGGWPGVYVNSVSPVKVLGSGADTTRTDGTDGIGGSQIYLSGNPTLIVDTASREIDGSPVMPITVKETYRQDEIGIQKITSVSQVRGVSYNEHTGINIKEYINVRATQDRTDSTQTATKVINHTDTLSQTTYQVGGRDIISNSEIYVPITLGANYSLPLGKQFAIGIGVDAGLWLDSINRQYRYTAVTLTTSAYDENYLEAQVSQRHLTRYALGNARVDLQQSASADIYGYTAIYGRNRSTVETFNVTRLATVTLASPVLVVNVKDSNSSTAPGIITLGPFGRGQISAPTGVNINLSDPTGAASPPAAGVSGLLVGAFIANEDPFNIDDNGVFLGSALMTFKSGITTAPIVTIRQDGTNGTSNTIVTTNTIVPNYPCVIVIGDICTAYYVKTPPYSETRTTGVWVSTVVPTFNLSTIVTRLLSVNVTQLIHMTIDDPNDPNGLQNITDSQGIDVTTTRVVNVTNTMHMNVTHMVSVDVTDSQGLAVRKNVDEVVGSLNTHVIMDGTVITVLGAVSVQTGTEVQQTMINARQAVVSDNALKDVLTDQAVQVKGVIIPKVSFQWNPSPDLTFTFGAKVYVVLSGYSDYYSAEARARADSLGITYKKDQLLWYGGVNVGIEYTF